MQIRLMKKEDVQRQLCGPERAVLTDVVRQALGGQPVELTDWSIDVLGGWSMGSATGGLFRVSGRALDCGKDAPWSVILKIISRHTPGAQRAFRNQAHPLYWKREALAYQSGLLDDLPGGLRAPRCYAIVEREAGTIWLWLEEVKDADHNGWDLEQYAVAARCLGRFNGAYLVDHPMPTYPWLVRNGSPRGLLNHNTWVRGLMAEPATWQHPLVRSVFPVPVADRLLRLWDERKILLNALDRVQHTFSHLDAWRGNMLSPSAFEDTTGSDRLVLLDWAYPGQAAIGTDAGDLFVGSFNLSELGDTEPRLRDQAIFDSYLAGLQDAGWQGDVSMVRFSFAAYCAMKGGCFPVWLSDVADQRRQAFWESQSNLCFSDFAHQQARLLYYLLDLADEARNLLS